MREKNEGQGKLVCVCVCSQGLQVQVCALQTTEEKDVVKFVSKPGEELSRSDILT